MWIVIVIVLIVMCVVIAIKCSSDPSDDVVMTVTYKEKPMERSHEFINVINAPSEPTEVLSTPVESKSESSQNVSEDNFAEDKPKKTSVTQQEEERELKSVVESRKVENSVSSSESTNVSVIEPNLPTQENVELGLIDESENDFICDNNARGEIVTEIYFELKGLYYRDSYAVREVEKLRNNDKLYFLHEADNPVDQYAMKVMTETGVFIGYVDKNCSKEFFMHQSDFIKCSVIRVKTEYKIPYVHLLAEYDGMIIVCGNNVDCNFHKLHDYITPAMQLKAAGKLLEAADAFVYAGEKEPFSKEKIKAYHQACVCYRKSQNYNKEIEIINTILQTLSAKLNSKQLFSYQNRLATATRFKENLAKKEDKIKSD